MNALLGGAAAVLSAAIWAWSSTAMTAPARTWGGRATNLFKSVVAAVLFAATILVAFGPAAFRLSEGVWTRFAISGVLGLAIADTAYLNALRHIGPTLTAIVYETSGIFTCVLGLAFLGERLTIAEIVAMGLIIGGVLLALLDDPPAHVEPGHRARGAGFALLAALVHSTGLIFNKDAILALHEQHGVTGMRGAMTAGFARMASAAAGLLLFGAVSGSFARQTRPLREGPAWRATFLPAVMGSFIAMITMQLALTLMKTGPASVLLSTTPIFTIPIASRLLGHKPSLRAIAGAVIALGGIALLTFG
jgi:drug/metabolite transporter (DMT)-like permease